MRLLQKPPTLTVPVGSFFPSNDNFVGLFFITIPHNNFAYKMYYFVGFFYDNFA